MKYSREKASKVMRVVSILGVICLLALQWVWWRNAFRAVEMDFMSKAQECLKQATTEEIIYRMDSTSTTGIKIIHTQSTKEPKGDIAVRKNFNKSEELEYLFDEFITISKRPVNVHKIEQRFEDGLIKKLGFIPDYSLRIVIDSIQMDSTYKEIFNRWIIGQKHNLILHQFGYKKYVEVQLDSPVKLILLKGKTILFISIFLALLLGAILIYQYISMQRERKFSDFIIDYTRMITHDLKSPVSGLQMMFKFLKRDLSEQPDKLESHIIDGMSLSKKIMLNLDNILYTAISEHRELKVRLNDTPIGEFMERVVDSYRIRSYYPKNIVYKTYYEPEHFRCSMDMSLMENVMYNLIDNAIKFTPMETLIEIFCSKIGNEVVIRVKDNGMGIPANEQKRIFDLFEQGYTNQSSQFPGFGIGLHFVQLVLRAHDGKVSVQSEVGKGTEFTLRFISKEYS